MIKQLDDGNNLILLKDKECVKNTTRIKKDNTFHNNNNNDDDSNSNKLSFGSTSNILNTSINILSFSNGNRMIAEEISVFNFSSLILFYQYGLLLKLDDNNELVIYSVNNTNNINNNYSQSTSISTIT